MELIKQTELDKIKEKAMAFLDEPTFMKECGFAIQQINASPKLLEADRSSLLQAVYNVALTGLSLNPVHKLAYLIPRFTGGKIKASLDPSYQGLVKLLTDTGSVKSVYAHPVYKGDDFKVKLGTSTEIDHTPNFKSKELEKVYAVAVLHDGTNHIEVMTAEEVNEIRDRSESYKAYLLGKVKSCIWSDYYPEMCRKTVIKRLVKYLPKTDRFEQLAQAVHIDNEDYLISNEEQYYLLESLDRAKLDDDKMKHLTLQIKAGITRPEAEKIRRQYLEVDQITHGNGYSQTDIKNHLGKL